MSDAPTQSAPPASDPGHSGIGSGGPLGSPEAPISTSTTSSGKAVVRPGDRVFTSLATGSAIFISVLIGAIGLFLVWRAVPALSRNEANFLTSRSWATTDINNMAFGVLDLLQVTVLVSVFALAIAMPVALGIAIFLTQYSPAKISRPLAYTIDLLAAVPSIVFGIWGMQVLGPSLGGIFEWVHGWAGSFFLFQWDQQSSPAFSTSRNVFTGGVVLAIMILPIIAATTREVFVQTPRGHIEAALALGATRWEVVRMTVLPFGRSGYVSGAMLGLGRALGETMALYMVIASAPGFRWSLFDGGTTFATAIANAAPEFNDDTKAGAYISAGLVLFALTFIVNAAARTVVKNTK